MRVVVGSLKRFSSLRVSNVYLLDGGPGARWLVDCGHPIERLQLLAELRATGLSPRDLAGVLLTHRHSDHAGNAGFLRRRYGLTICAQRADAEALDGTSPNVTRASDDASLLERAFVAVENRFPARTPVDRALDDGDEVAGLEVHWVPGHTEGSAFFRHAPTRTLLTGDTILTAFPPLTLRQGLNLVHPPYALDLQQAYTSLESFHRLGHDYDHILAGHGDPLVTGARRRVLELMARQGLAVADATLA